MLHVSKTLSGSVSDSLPLKYLIDWQMAENNIYFGPPVSSLIPPDNHDSLSPKNLEIHLHHKNNSCLSASSSLLNLHFKLTLFMQDFPAVLQDKYFSSYDNRKQDFCHSSKSSQVLVFQITPLHIYMDACNISTESNMKWWLGNRFYFMASPIFGYPGTEKS